MLQHFFIPQIVQYGVTGIFQQKGATSHTATMSINILKDLFPNRIISRNWNIPWPPRSPDITACDFFLWGYIKSRVYQPTLRTLDDLKQKIREEVTQISILPEILRNVITSFQRRLDESLLRNGRHLTNIIYKN
jgi:hypothetical protein